MQRTALGAADVPDVNNNAHSASTSGSDDADLVRRSVRACGPGCFECPVERLARNERIVAVGEAVGDEDATSQLYLRYGRFELGPVSRFGDHELHVGMVDVPGQVLAVSGVVQPDDGGRRQPRATQREHVVGRVVEEHTDMTGTVRIEAGAEQRGKALCFGQELGVAPHSVPEAKRGPISVLLLGTVPAQQGGCVRSGKRNFGQRWGEGGWCFAGHRRSIPSDRLGLSGRQPRGGRRPNMATRKRDTDRQSDLVHRW